MDVDDGSRKQAVDMAKVATREFVMNGEQRQLRDYVYAHIGRSCANSEEGVALLGVMLADFIKATAKSELLPEAVETAVACLRINIWGCR